ncbi:hypothetical protein BSKO_08576 [Bryopsis sp. KO-2023]|nr:hypothetical protein BSKO_08576 [Bryopsis sp. KO-2023]
MYCAQLGGFAPPSVRKVLRSRNARSWKPKTPHFNHSIRGHATSTVGSTATDLFHWLEDQGAKDLMVEVQSAEVGGRTIDRTVTKQAVKPGEVVLRIPSHAVVTLDRVFQDASLAELLTTNKLSELACLTLYMMYEKKQGTESFWHPYIRELDNQRARGQQGVESPILWPEEEVERLFAGSPLLPELKSRVEGIKKEYQECDTVWYLAGSLFDKYPYDIPTEAFSEQLFMQAFTAIQACVVHLQGVALSQRFALVPLGPPLTSYSSTSKAMLQYNPNTKSVDLVADREYKAGELISAWCGPQTNKRLLINYGIVDENNPYDWLQIKIRVPNSDPLFQAKRSVLMENGLSTQEAFKLQRGRPIPKMLLPYMRVIYETDPAEMDKLTAMEGVGPRESEGAILHQVASVLQGKLDNYRTTSEQDDETIASSSNPREVVAAKLLHIEKEILNSALDEILAKPGAPERSSLGLEDGKQYPVDLS